MDGNWSGLLDLFQGSEWSSELGTFISVGNDMSASIQIYQDSSLVSNNVSDSDRAVIEIGRADPETIGNSIGHILSYTLGGIYLAGDNTGSISMFSSSTIDVDLY